MGILDDKKFEEMDWISQATEPIDSQLNTILGGFPDEFIIDYNTYFAILKMGNDSIFGLWKHTIMNYVAHEFNLPKFGSLSYKEMALLESCFTLSIEPDTILNLNTKQLSKPIVLKKIKNSLEDKELSKILGAKGVNSLYYLRINDENVSRAHEIMDIVGKCDSGLRTKSFSKKSSILHNRVRDIFSNNEWLIKDGELADKIGLWMSSYIIDGNLAALSNLYRLKVMTHKQQAIYSIEEV